MQKRIAIARSDERMRGQRHELSHDGVGSGPAFAMLRRRHPLANRVKGGE
jgi:hypothetical protein